MNRQLQLCILDSIKQSIQLISGIGLTNKTFFLRLCDRVTYVPVDELLLQAVIQRLANTSVMLMYGVRLESLVIHQILGVLLNKCRLELLKLDGTEIGNHMIINDVFIGALGCLFTVVYFT
jgi:hypothetical protein